VAPAKSKNLFLIIVKFPVCQKCSRRLAICATSPGCRQRRKRRVTPGT
jgi:hypothetical protein